MLFSLTLALLHVALPEAPFPESGPTPAPESDSPCGLWWQDYDGDGLQDAFAIDARGAVRLLRNEGDGSFVDVTRVSGLDGLCAASFASWHDFDRDGAPDLYVGAESGAGRLLRNARDGTFQDVTEFVGLGHGGRALAV